MVTELRRLVTRSALAGAAVGTLLAILLVGASIYQRSSRRAPGSSVVDSLPTASSD